LVYDELSDMSTILIADDHAPSRELVRDVVEGLGLRAAEAGDGIEALHIIRTEHLRLAFVDIRMPGMGGITIMEAIGDLACARRPTMIALSACVMDGDLTGIQLAGFDHLLTKPFPMVELRRLIWQLIPEMRLREKLLARAAGFQGD
jgi:CheY-like chemotaxis protein